MTIFVHRLLAGFSSKLLKQGMEIVVLNTDSLDVSVFGPFIVIASINCMFYRVCIVY